MDPRFFHVDSVIKLGRCPGWSVFTGCTSFCWFYHAQAQICLLLLGEKCDSIRKKQMKKKIQFQQSVFLMSNKCFLKLDVSLKINVQLKLNHMNKGNEISQTAEMRCDMTKPTKWVCAQRRLGSAWASAQSDQSLRCLHEESIGP